MPDMHQFRDLILLRAQVSELCAERRRHDILASLRARKVDTSRDHLLKVDEIREGTLERDDEHLVHARLSRTAMRLQ